MNDVSGFGAQRASEECLDDKPNQNTALARLRVQMERTVQKQAAEQHELDGDQGAKEILSLDFEAHPIRRFVNDSAKGPANVRNHRHRLATCYRLIVGREGYIEWSTIYAYQWHLLELSDLERFETGLRAGEYQPASRNSYRAALRTVIHNCRKAGLITARRAERLLDRIPLETFQRAPVGRAIPSEELEMIMSALEDRDSWRTTRDQAIVAVLATTGMRISEVLQLTLDDADLQGGWLTLKHTKNGCPHRVPIAAGLVPYLTAWLVQRGESQGPLFLARKNQFGSHMTFQVVRNLLRRATHAAGIKSVTPHDFRRTVATTLLRSHDPSVVMRLLNHRSLNSTLAYDRCGEDLQALAVDSLPIPALTNADEEVA